MDDRLVVYAKLLALESRRLMLISDALAILFFFAQIFFSIATALFAVSSLDDLYFDALFFLRYRCGRIDADHRHKPVRLEDMVNLPEQPLAIMLPAWKEAEVLTQSVSNIIHSVAYKNFHIFIGTYPNDSQTQAQADHLAAEYAKVHNVITPLPGPTCKADCLNAIIAAIGMHEKFNGMRFAGYVLHDAEDIVHPFSLHLYNYYLPRYELVQIPVLSLSRKWFDFTGGHYMDEFAEAHTKEMITRQIFAGVVPGAGVGTAYSARAIAFASESGEIFNTASLTEDYDFSFRLSAAGMRQIFARIPAGDPHNGLGRAFNYGPWNPSDIIATREFFPNAFWAAVRQKTRWFIGISLQGWQLLGWRGAWTTKYLFWRDRKMLFFSHAIVLGLLAFLIFAAFWVYHSIDPQGYRMAPLMAEDNPFWYVVYFNLFMLVYRILQRSWWTGQCYGLSSIPLIIPRYVWGSIINYLATVRAIKIFFTCAMAGKPIGWDKTAHEFPTQLHPVALTRESGTFAASSVGSSMPEH